MASAFQCETWEQLSILYEKLKSSCCCSENRDDMKKAIRNSLQSDDYAEDKLRVCLLGLSTVELVGRMLWQQNHFRICTEFEWLSRNIISTDVIDNLVETLPKCDNNHIIYSKRKCLLALLFHYPKEMSAEVEKYLLLFLTQSISERQPNYNVLDLFHKIICFERPQAQSFNSGCQIQYGFICQNQCKYDLDDRCNEIKANFIKAILLIWNDLLLLSKGQSCSDEMKFLILEIWSCVIITSLRLQLDFKEISMEQSQKEVLDVFSQSSSTTCAKLCEVLNQVLSINYLQTGQSLPLEILPLSEDICRRTKNAWLDKISLKTRCNNFIGKQENSSGSNKVCPIHLRNIILIILKSVNFIIKHNEHVQSVHILFVLEILMKWLRNKWNEDRGMYIDQKGMIELFLDQDDQLLEMMICSLNIYLYLQKASSVDTSSNEDVTWLFNPHMLFLHFIQQLNYGYSLLLDLLTSSETCALFYLLQYLKLIKFDWRNFIYSHEMMKERRQDIHIPLSKCSDDGGEKMKEGPRAGKDSGKLTESSCKLFKNKWASSVHDTFEMLAKLCSRIQILQDKGLFPYNAHPLIRILNDCETLYSCSGT